MRGHSQPSDHKRDHNPDKQHPPQHPRKKTRVLGTSNALCPNKHIDEAGPEVSLRLGKVGLREDGR